MEANSLSILSLHLDLVQVGIVGILLFTLGFWLGRLRIRKMIKQMAKMEKKIMDLNSELLYGVPDHS
ncbi:MAG TPA: hypothetical protein VHD83_16570 [Puia sp.]|nr:hypothetical protein [Puia sp.]